MKSTGIVRRIDDLGRVVIPKEIRRTMGVQDGDPLEIGVDGNKVVLWKYVPEGTAAINLTAEEIDFLAGVAVLQRKELPEGLCDKLEAARERLYP